MRDEKTKNKEGTPPILPTEDENQLK